MITPQQIALGERLRVDVMYSSMKRPAAHHLDHGILCVFDAASLGFTDTHSFTFYNTRVVQNFVSLSLEPYALIGIWFTHITYTDDRRNDLHSQIFRFLLNHGMPEEKLLHILNLENQQQYLQGILYKQLHVKF